MCKLEKNYKYFIIFILIVLIFCLIFKIKSNNYKFTTINNTQMQKIMNTSDNENAIVLIGRPTCNDCAILKPKLDKILKKFKLSAFYYNTKIAREDNNVILEQILLELGIERVPTIIYFEKGKPKKVFTGDNIDTKFIDFIKSDNFVK